MRVRVIRFGVCVAMVGMGLGCAAVAQGPVASPGDKLAATVMRDWPAGELPLESRKDGWRYEEGVLLDGLAAQWHVTANGAEFKYIQASVDRYVGEDGTIAGYPVEAHSLDNIEMGRAVMLLYRVTQKEKYYKAAKFLHEQLAVQPRTASGGYWHKQIYPNQMWLDGAYMAEPFRAAYAATFQQTEDFDDIAKELLLMDAKMRDPQSGLLKHGWDESKQMSWADKSTGLSPEVWARAMGWYCVALVDVLDWFPQGHPQRKALIAVLEQRLKDVMQYRDISSGLWWQVMKEGPDVVGTIGPNGKMQYETRHPEKKGNFVEASASAMFVYSIAKSVRKGYLPLVYQSDAREAWESIQKRFVTTAADGSVTLHGTVKVGGLGGTPYRSGTFDYYIGEKIGDQDAKGVGAYLLAGSEMAQLATAGIAQIRTDYLLGGSKGKLTVQELPGASKTVMVDAWFNSQTRKNAAGQTELFHYKWDDDTNNGFAFFGRAFEWYGATLAEEKVAPGTKEGMEELKTAKVFIMASPDIPSKNPQPNYMDKASGDAIEAWVRAGGVLLLMQNDGPNAEFEHFNTLSDRFGLHFNPVLRNHVVNDDFPAGTLMIPAGTGVFAQAHQAYLKDTCTITVSKTAKAVVRATTEPKSDLMIAVAKVGKGTVFAVTDPWLYNEYVDRRNNLPLEYDGFAAAIDLAGWALQQAR